MQIPPLPELVTTVTASGAVFSGQNVGISYHVANNGTGPTSVSSWYDSVYLSTNNFFDSSAVPRVCASLWRRGEWCSGYTENNLQVTMPVGISGSYYFIVVADNNQSVYQLSSAI